MSDISTVMVGKIIEGALDGDIQKVKAYAQLIAEKLEEQDNLRASKIIRSKLDGSYKNSEKIVALDSSEPEEKIYTHKEKLIDRIKDLPDDIQVFVNDKMPCDAIDIRIFTKPKDGEFIKWYFGP